MPCKQDWINTVCPKCSTAQTFYAYKIADVGDAPEIKEKLFQGELNVFKCVNCGAGLHYDEYLIYTDREKGLIINVFSKDYRENADLFIKRIFEEMFAVPPDEALPNYVVFGYPDLAKILALMERRLKDISASEKKGLSPEDYQRLFVLAEGLLNLMSRPGYEAKFMESEEPFNEAGQFLKDKQFEKARDAYTAALEIFPDLYEANLNLGLLYFNEFGMPDKALPLFEKCRLLRPNESEIYFGLGQAYLKLKAPDKAVPNFYRSLISAPLSSLAWFNLGLGLWMQNKKDEGLDMLERSMALSYNADDRALIARTIKTLTEKM